MADQYGDLDHVFGQVDEAFYAAVGRIAMLTTLLDERLLDLQRALSDLTPDKSDAQDRLAGEPASVLIRQCRKDAHKLPGRKDTDSWGLRESVVAFLDDAEQAEWSRNDVIHSVWPNPALDSAFAWRSVRANQRVGPGVLKTFTTNKDAFQAQIAELVQLIDRVGRLLSLVHFERIKRYNATLPITAEVRTDISDE